MLQELIGTLVWLAVNGLYIDMKRKGRQGLARIIFFWMGNPATWLWFFLVPEGKKKVELKPPPDDFHDLLAEIRRDRALNSGDGERLPAEEAGEDPAARWNQLEARPGSGP
jgi:hypothetical protein